MEPVPEQVYDLDDDNNLIIATHMSYKFNTRYTFSLVNTVTTMRHNYITYSYINDVGKKVCYTFIEIFGNGLSYSSTFICDENGNNNDFTISKYHVKLCDISKYNIGIDHHDSSIIKILLKHPHKFSRTPTKIVNAYTDMIIRVADEE